MGYERPGPRARQWNKKTEEPKQSCWECGSTELVIEPDPTMQNLTDRVRCANCGEMN